MFNTSELFTSFPELFCMIDEISHFICITAIPIGDKTTNYCIIFNVFSYPQVLAFRLEISPFLLNSPRTLLLRFAVRSYLTFKMLFPYYPLTLFSWWWRNTGWLNTSKKILFFLNFSPFRLFYFIVSTCFYYVKFQTIAQIPFHERLLLNSDVTKFLCDLQNSDSPIVGLYFKTTIFYI